MIEDHLRCRSEGDLEADPERNYASGVVLLSAEGLHCSHDGVRQLASVLESYLPEGKFEDRDMAAEGRYALVNWSGHDTDRILHDGADSFVVEHGKILAQTIHFSSRRHGS